MKIRFELLTDPTREATEAFSRWENDPLLIPISRPNASRADIDKRQPVTVIGRIPDFTFHQGKMWQDIRMEKHLRSGE